MALGIDTAHTFNITQLFEKLCQMKCDGKDCDTLLLHTSMCSHSLESASL
jgi:hypothetical protein